MFSHYRLDMACLCCIVFICLCFLCFGLEHGLIWFLIEFRSFRLLIRLVSSPNDVATLLFVLIRWVVFVLIFRDEFSTICQSFIVFVVREGVTIRNPQMDSKSEFGCPNTAEERERCAGGVPWPPRVEAVCHTAQHALWSRVAHTPHMGTRLVWLVFVGQKCPSSPSFKCLLFPPFLTTLTSSNWKILQKCSWFFVDLLWS